MKPRFLLSLALMLALSVSLAAQEKSQAPAGGKPKLVIDELTHDFGEVAAGTPLTHSFIVRNTGTADLLIQSVTPG